VHVNVRRGLGAVAGGGGAGAGDESADAFFARVHAANLDHLQADADAGAAESVTGGARPRLVRAAPGGLLSPQPRAWGASGGARARCRARARARSGRWRRALGRRGPASAGRPGRRGDAGLLQALESERASPRSLQKQGRSWGAGLGMKVQRPQGGRAHALARLFFSNCSPAVAHDRAPVGH